MVRFFLPPKKHAPQCSDDKTYSLLLVFEKTICETQPGRLGYSIKTNLNKRWRASFQSSCVSLDLSLYCAVLD